MRVSDLRELRCRFLGRGLAPTALAICLLGALALACSPAAEEGSSGSAQESVEGTTGTAAQASDGKGALRHRPISRLGKARANRGHLQLVYGQLSTADHEELEKIFREERFFEDILADLNQSLILPRNIPVRLEECEDVNAFYSAEDGSVTLCYELLEHFLELFGNQAQTDEEQEEAGGKAVAALVFAFYHELGHALIDVYNLPATGREEDAVDQLATVMLLETWEGEDSELAILSSAEWFDLDASEEAEDETDMADEHALNEQRYYNLVCWIYGSDPEYFSDVVDDWELPPARAERCEGEYQRMSQAWDALLGPHLQPVSG